MAARGEVVPMPDAAIFADTQWEPAHIYTHLDWLESQLPFPVYRVTAGSIRDSAVSQIRSDGKTRYAAIPWHMPGAMGMRQCTKEYKIEPIRRKVRELSRMKPVRQWIGISTDEAVRMKPSNVKYIAHIFPLIDLGMSRRDCEKWFNANYPGRELRKSSCLGCPYHSDRQWREIKANPEEWRDVVEVDRAIRDKQNFKRQQFMHRSLKPIYEVDFSTAEDLGQLNMFNNECEGMCGV